MVRGERQRARYWLPKVLVEVREALKDGRIPSDQDYTEEAANAVLESFEDMRRETMDVIESMKAAIRAKIAAQEDNANTTHSLDS